LPTRHLRRPRHRGRHETSHGLEGLRHGRRGAVALSAGGFGVYNLAAGNDTAGKVAFDTALRIPPLTAARSGAEGTRVFSLGIEEGENRFKNGPATRTWV
jgi:hypothetical protein